MIIKSWIFTEKDYSEVSEFAEYVGESAQSDGTLLGDFRKAMHHMFLTELVRGMHMSFHIHLCLSY